MEKPEEPPSKWSYQEIQDFSHLNQALMNYRSACHLEIQRFEEKKWRKPEDIQKLKDAVTDNSDLFEFMAQNSLSVFGLNPETFPFMPISTPFSIKDLDQLSEALKSAARDWTELGDQERFETYSPIIACLNEFLPKSSSVIIPGSGVCRLAVEIAAEGFHVVANESAFIMIITSMFSMKFYSNIEKSFIIHPFLHDLQGQDNVDSSIVSGSFPSGGHCNKCLQKFSQELFETHKIEENCSCLDPMNYLSTGELNLMAGSFDETIRSINMSFDCVITCYFIDVVKDQNQLIEDIFNILEIGGFWINFGPLVIHESDDMFFPEITQKDILLIAKRLGFKVVKEQQVKTSYIQNLKGHMFRQYNCQLTVFQK